MAPLPSQPFSAPTHSSRGAGRLALGNGRASASLHHVLCGQGARAAWWHLFSVLRASGGLGRRQRCKPNRSLQHAVATTSAPSAPVGSRRIFDKGPYRKWFMSHSWRCKP